MKYTLNQVAEHFEQWRSTRKKRSRTPDFLIQQAVALIGHYSNNQIVKTLRINLSALRQWKAQWDQNQSEPMELIEEKTSFIELTPPSMSRSPASTLTSSNLSLELQFKQGARLNLSGTHSQSADFIFELQQRGVL